MTFPVLASPWHGLTLHPDQPRQGCSPDLDRLQSFRVFPLDDIRHAEDAGLFLQIPGVGKHDCFSQWEEGL